MDPKVFFRFDEASDEMRPRDAAGSLDDLLDNGALKMPPLVDGIVGMARKFESSETTGLTATDLVPGSTLFNRDCTVRAIVRIPDLAAMLAAGTNTLIVRGKGDSAAEYAAYGIELRVVNLGGLIVEVRWIWHDAAGALKTQLGGHFAVDPLGFFMLTATRRWVSSTEVRLRYYFGDVRINEVTSVDGSIGGGTTAETAIGARWTGAAYANLLCAEVDEIQVYDRVLSHEEIRATWDRITVQQPRGHRLLVELHDPGFPLNPNQTSRQAKETRLWGYALGYATAQAENIRNNIHPDRAYGRVLERWEAMSGAVAKPGDDIDTRRARAVAYLRARQGESIPGLQTLIEELVATDAGNLEFLAFQNSTYRDLTTAAADDEAVTSEPSASWVYVGGSGERVNPGAASYPFDPAAGSWSWWTMVSSIPSASWNVEGLGVVLAGSWLLTTLPANAEGGIYLGNVVDGNYVLLGLRNAAGTYQMITQKFTAGVGAAAVVQQSYGGALPANIFLRLRQLIQVSDGFGAGLGFRDIQAEWSTTSPTAGFALAPVISMPPRWQWNGFYFRTFSGSTALSALAYAYGWGLRSPYGDRPFHAYVYRDPALPGTPDQVGIHNALQGIKQAHTELTFAASKSTLCDTEGSYCDRTPLGGY